jgi:tRNA (guanine-N7-)-methyltransferase
MKREIRSFVRRAGRTTIRQQHGLAVHLLNYQLQNNACIWDFEEIFGRVAETVVEIGFGMGASLLEMAQQNPHLNYIGIEVHQAGLGNLAAGLAELELSNVRIVAGDATEIFRDCIPKASLLGIQVFFPDPWPKKRHHKRRLIQQPFVSLLASALQKGGFLHCATDWEDYALSMKDVLDSEPTFENQDLSGGFSPRPASRPYTKFELRGAKLGHSVFDLMFLKK